MSHRFADVPDDQQLTKPLRSDLTAVTYQRFAVDVVSGDDAGARATSEGEELSIGTARGNGLVLTDRSVSRHHCIITATADGFRIKDLDSTNGVKLGGFKVEAAFLKTGASFKLGRTKLRFAALDEHVSEPVSPEEAFGGVLGRSAAMRRIFAVLPRVAATDTTVLVEGETGTGKTLLASAIHDASPRRDGPFMVVDCGAVTGSLIESHLFGNARGAFTGATEARDGAFVAATGGTVLLDEVGELPLELQPKLLRVLEERVVTPLGTTRQVPIDVRVIAATNRDLREEVNRGRFRADLFYRLHVVRLRVPPLRERPDDVEVLARHFWSECAPGRALPDDLLTTWRQLRWSGNVRELRAAVDRAILLGGLEEARGEDRGPASYDPNLSFRALKEQIVERFERDYLGRLFEDNDRNISQTARAARMDRNHLRELLRKHGVL
ncbi:MAG TPA: sigma 54-dependent Fis family transcriptional regulator [Polyangiaceae bacterium]|nr:sigma 54-dependent Fis family transcriptional regulator [Polyangiaceae bacterium]